MTSITKTFSKSDIPQIAQEIVAGLKVGESATIVALSGDLGVGKTTLSQAIARELGVKENVISPTFVIMKTYEIKAGQNSPSGNFARLVHIDAYRLNSSHELTVLGWHDLVSDPKNIILIEWPEIVADCIPSTAHRVTLAHKNEEEREITISF